MLTKVFTTAFKLLLLGLLVTLFAACKPPGPKALLDGKRLLEKGRAEAAVDRLEVATQLMSTNAQAWNYLGIAYHETGQMSNAVVAYNRALALNSDLVETRLNLGSLWLELGRAAEAKSEFTAYNLRRPTAPEGFGKLALAELHLRETAAAEQHIRKSLQLDDANPDAWNTLGLIQLQQRKPREAAKSFGSALSHRPDFAPALINLAVVTQQQLGDRAGALKLYRQYLGLKPRPADADQVAAVVHQLEQELMPARPVAPAPAPPQSAPSLARAAQPSPANPESAPASTPPSPPPVKPTAVQPTAPTSAPSAQLTRRPPNIVKPTVAPEAKGEPAEAAPPPSVVQVSAPKPAAPISTSPVTSARKEAGPEPSQQSKPVSLSRWDGKRPYVTPLPSRQETVEAESESPAYLAQGAGRLEAGDRGAAERFAAKGAKAMATKRYVQASEAYAAAAKADPGWYQAHFNHAAAAIEAGQTSEALAACEQALALKPDSTEARYNFALALKQGGYYKDAAAQLERVLAANPTDARAHLTLGNLCADQLQRLDKAKSHYLKVLEINPQHPRAGAIHFWLAAHPDR